jgi:hypothetical protein
MSMSALHYPSHDSVDMRYLADYAVGVPRSFN